MSNRFRPRPQPGAVIHQGGVSGSLTIPANTVIAIPWAHQIVPPPLVDQVQFRITSAGVGAGPGVLAALYHDLGGLPGGRFSPIIASAPTEAGNVPAAIDPWLELPPLLWAVFLAGSFATTQPTLSAAIGNANVQAAAGLGNFISTGQPLAASAGETTNALSLARTFAEGLPDLWPSGTAWAQANNQAMPYLGARVAAYSPRPIPPTSAAVPSVPVPGALQVPSGGVQSRTPSTSALPSGLPTTPGGMST